MEVPPGQRLIQIHNRCGIDVYPGMIGQGGGAVPGPPEGWKFEPGDCRTLKVPSIFPSIRIWGRTGCNNGTNGGDFKCQTGNCVVNGTYTDILCYAVRDRTRPLLRFSCAYESTHSLTQWLTECMHNAIPSFLPSLDNRRSVLYIRGQRRLSVRSHAAGELSDE